jgi:hypothetical protein
MVDRNPQQLICKSSFGGKLGGHLFFYDDVVLLSHGSHELAAYLILAGSLNEVRQYCSWCRYEQRETHPIEVRLTVYGSWPMENDRYLHVCGH